MHTTATWTTARARAAASAATAAAAAGRRRGRRASVGVVEDVVRLRTTVATTRRCLGRRRNTAEGGRSVLVSAP